MLPSSNQPASLRDRASPFAGVSIARPTVSSSSTQPLEPQPPPSLLLSVFRFLVRLPASALLAAIWLYQRTLSPVLPIVLGPSFGCRFAPTCSHYGAEALRTHGAIVGTWLTLLRLLKCTPLHPGGFDPVPPRVSPRCVRLTARPAPSRS